MNKNLRKIIALALVISTISAAAPSTNLNMLTTRAYASTNDREELESLKLETSSGKNIQLYGSSSYDDKVSSDDVSDRGIYYAKTSSGTISIDTDGPSSKYVKVFKGTSSSTKGKSENSDISLSSGTNTIIVKVYSSTPDSDVRYDDDDNVVSKYTIKIKYTGSDYDTNDNSDSYDDIYLDSLSIDGTSISLSNSKTIYNYNVSDSVDEVRIKAEPDHDDYDVIIDGTSVDSSDNYKENVSLKRGKNEIKIKIKNDGDERVYTLNITRGDTSSYSAGTISGADNIVHTATSEPSSATTITTPNINKWVQENGAWKYYDQRGNQIKSQWFYDANLAKMYYLQEDGSMATYWKKVNEVWYYLGSDGAKKYGWQSVNGNWYYLDGQGAMVAEKWIHTDNGKYYYLNSDGSMAYSTTIGSYRLGADGAWVGHA